MLMPAFDIVLNRMAPEGKKASYFALYDLRQIGSSVGPVVGGLVYANSRTGYLFSSVALSCLLSLALFLQCQRQYKLG